MKIRKIKILEEKFFVVLSGFMAYSLIAVLAFIILVIFV